MDQAKSEMEAITAKVEQLRREQKGATNSARRTLLEKRLEMEATQKALDKLEEPFHKQCDVLFKRTEVLEDRMQLYDKMKEIQADMDMYVNNDTFDLTSDYFQWSRGQLLFTGNRFCNYYWNDNSSGHFCNTKQVGDVDVSKAKDYEKGANEHSLDTYKAHEIAGDKTRPLPSRYQELSAMIRAFLEAPIVVATETE